MDFDPSDNSWMWLYKEEAKSIIPKIIIKSTIHSWCLVPEACRKSLTFLNFSISLSII